MVIANSKRQHIVIISLLILSIATNIILAFYLSKQMNIHKELVQTTTGIIRDEQIAKDIAEVIWKSNYGDRMEKKKPYIAELKDSVWYVRGTLPGIPGGVPHLEINAFDSRVINLWRSK
jgi:hypothetical protein